MPTYDYKCPKCGAETAVFQSIGEYSRTPNRPSCHGEMERKLCVVPGTSTSNPLAGDRHYDGLHASDGTPIDTRTKHRQYMKEKGLTINTDFTETWKAAAVEREKISSGVSLADRRRDVQEAFSRATQN